MKMKENSIKFKKAIDLPIKEWILKQRDVRLDKDFGLYSQKNYFQKMKADKISSYILDMDELKGYIIYESPNCYHCHSCPGKCL